MTEGLGIGDGPHTGGRQDVLRQSECTITYTELCLPCKDEAY